MRHALDRRGAGADDADPLVAQLVEVADQRRQRRFIGADGRERWFRAAHHHLLDGGGKGFYLTVLHDVTAEHVARERAERSAHELDEWFDLSPVGMVLYDERGFLVRTNPAFELLAGTLPTLLPEATEGVQHLLAWVHQLSRLEIGRAHV